jgi:hypothetical protein
MRWPPPPFFVILARRPFSWYPCLELTNDDDRDAFQAIAARLVNEFRGEIVERYGGDGPADKEYWWFDIESKRLLLMRKGPRSESVFSAQTSNCSCGSPIVSTRALWDGDGSSGDCCDGFERLSDGSGDALRGFA